MVAALAESKLQPVGAGSSCASAETREGVSVQPRASTKPIQQIGPAILAMADPPWFRKKRDRPPASYAERGFRSRSAEPLGGHQLHQSALTFTWTVGA